MKIELEFVLEYFEKLVFDFIISVMIMYVMIFMFVIVDGFGWEK